MKISNKEKIMLYILGIILVGFGYYNFIYSVQVIKIQGKIKSENEIKQKYTSAMETINSLDDKKSDVKVLKAKIGDESISFYPTISEEHIIVQLDELLKDSGLKGAITFKPIVSDSVENSKKEENSLAESSLQSIVDKYSNIISSDEKDGSNNNEISNNDNTANDKSPTDDSAKTNVNNNSNSSTNNSTTSNAKANDSKDKKNTIQYLKCEVKFEGTYQALNKMLETIGKNEKKIVVNSIKITQSSLDAINGTIALEIYSVPKITDELEGYLKWELNNTYGKSVPFSKGAASGVVDSNKDNSDFIATIKSINSDLPTIMIGKSNDSLRTTYVYADSNTVENVEMTLTQDGNKYYYKYKTSKGTFPAEYNGLGAEFVPVSKNIIISLISEARVGDNDKSNINLKIINKTDKLVEVNISGDDTINPRVKIDGDGNNISVNQK